jgi:hypothetical protein
MDADKEKFIFIDKQLRLHVVIKYFKKSKNYEDIIKYIFDVIEKTIELRKQYLNIITLETYVDLKDYKLKELDLEFIKMMIHYCQEKYPDNLDIIYVKNANIMIKSLYAIIRPFVDKETRKKIFFLKKKKKSKELKGGGENNESNEQINEENIDDLFN